MKLENRRIILASNSPRRRELLAGMGVEFTVDTQNNFQENFPPDIPHREIPALMSKGKSLGFHRALSPEEILITADTMVLLDNVMFGKPHSRDEAFRMLRLLSGHTHEVITAVTLRDCDRMETFTDSTYVTFRNLTDKEILWYVDNYQPFDKAGSYGVQEWIGYIAISDLKGSFYNVMGFPTHLVYGKLLKFAQRHP